jgi:hypothetical protein
MKSFFTPGKVCLENHFNFYVVVYLSVIIGLIVLFFISLKIHTFQGRKYNYFPVTSKKKPVDTT